MTFDRLHSTRECPLWHAGQAPRDETKADRLVRDFLASTFSLEVKEWEQDWYKLTVAIIERLIPGEMFGGLLYPDDTNESKR